MPTLRPEVKKAWTEALRSGKYSQGRDTLRDVNNNYCCLGVLCEIAANEGVIPAPKFNDVYDEWNYAGSSGTLPVVVQDWAYADFDPEDRQLADPYLDGCAASDWNDSREASFEDIAKLIEEHL